jgi:hypothetical protein
MRAQDRRSCRPAFNGLAAATVLAVWGPVRDDLGAGLDRYGRLVLFELPGLQGPFRTLSSEHALANLPGYPRASAGREFGDLNGSHRVEVRSRSPVPVPTVGGVLPFVALGALHLPPGDATGTRSCTACHLLFPPVTLHPSCLQHMRLALQPQPADAHCPRCPLSCGAILIPRPGSPAARLDDRHHLPMPPYRGEVKIDRLQPAHRSKFPSAMTVAYVLGRRPHMPRC